MESRLFTEGKSKRVKVFGLDLGTTNSVVTAKISNGLPEVLESHSGQTTPSCVMFNEDGTYTIGRDAYRQRSQENVVYSFKKYMGTPTKLYKDFTPRQISSIFVKQLLDEVKERNPQYADFTGVQVSVPAYFDINQIEDTKLAIKEAGYTVVGVNDEPTAAAILYQQVKRVKEDILIFDLGGGTFDAVLMRNIPGVPHDSKQFYKSLDVELPNSESVLEILDVTGDNRLGGDDIDEIAVDLYAQEHGLKLTPVERRQAILIAESVKKLGTPLSVEFHTEPFYFSYIEDATAVVYKKCKAIVDTMLKRTKINKVTCVLCGGSTKSNYIREELAKEFTVTTDIDPDLAVGIGDSVKYNMTVQDTGMTVVNRLAKGVGVLAGGRVKYLAEKGTIIPMLSKFSARNAEPFSDFVNIDLYQGDRFSGTHNHISTITLRDIEGHNEEGYASIVITLVITAEGTISVEVTSGKASAKTVLVLSESEEIKEDEEVHANATLYPKLKKAAAHYNDDLLNSLVDNYRVSGSRDLAKQITQYLSSLAK